MRESRGPEVLGRSLSFAASGGRFLGAAVSLTGGAAENARDFAAPLRV